MTEVDKDSIINISDMSDKELSKFMKSNGISLKLSEMRLISEKLGRDPTLTELHIFNTEWSEHCSYKSSRDTLKFLPTEGSTVIQGPKEDAGIIYFTTHKGDKYGIVIGHESHNHPSQVVPYEGAATGIGGILRDIICMGARVIATADPLRFGNPNGKFKERTRYIANSVIDGIAGYSNPVGIPNIGGDIYFSDSFDENCLVNVVCLGIIKEKDIIHSSAPKNAEGYDIILVGKATDNSGFGGAAFASVILDEKDEDANKGAVQVPDPFLKNIIMRATYNVFDVVRKDNINIGFKDLGAGGVMCASSELCESGDYGADVDLSKVHTSMDIPSYIIACSETQERFMWVSPPEFTQTILKIYNQDWELPNVAEGAQATVVGKVTKELDFVMRHEGKVVCNAPIKEVTGGIKYSREKKSSDKKSKEPELDEPSDYNKSVLNMLSSPNIASRSNVYEHYDTEVMGNAVIRPGEADAGLIKPISDCSAGMALSVDSNPRYARLDSYKGAVCAVAEAMRNVAAVGATPHGMTDCLNFGNPEVPEQFNDFVEGVKGVSDAARNIWLKGTKEPVPFVSGNVSFYNESSKGTSVDPSAVIACVGVIQDYSKAITMKLKKSGSLLFMLGKRKDELGGSEYYNLQEELGKNVPEIDFEEERGMIYSIIDLIDARLLLSCHDISDGGIVTTVSEMIMGGKADGKIGAEMDIGFSELRTDKTLFSESSGFVFEIDEANIEKMREICKKQGVEPIKIGKTSGNNLIISKDDKKIVDLNITEIQNAWANGLGDALK